MCMKYVNAITRCYNSISQNDKGQILSFNNPFDTISGYFESGHTFIRNFFIQIELTIMGTANEANKSENPISRRDVLHFTIRLTKCDSEPKKRLGIDIDKFDVNIGELEDKGLLSKACYPFYTCMRVINVKEIEFPTFDNGKYVLKILVRTTDNPEDDTIQSMSELKVLRDEANINSLEKN